MSRYDCFTFLNELELLELRLSILTPIIDYFVIVESNKTYAGLTKEFIFENNKNRFKPYLDKIKYIKIFQDQSDPWEAEYNQRNSILLGLDNIDDDDIIIISDLDEIPNPQSIIEYNTGTITRCRQQLFYYYVNWEVPVPLWNGSIIVEKKNLSTPQSLRNNRDNYSVVSPYIGWHFSNLTDIEKIQYKLTAYAETTTNTPQINNIEHIKNCLLTGSDLFLRNIKLNYVSLATYPKEIIEWANKYPQYIGHII